MLAVAGNMQNKEDPADKDEMVFKSNAQTEKLEFTWDVQNIRDEVTNLFKDTWGTQFESGKTVQ
jgi:hypothetical protein